MKKDPVCKMRVSEDAPLSVECEDKTYYFCSEGCRDKFLKDKAYRLPRTSYDLIIIGGGPAGLTAAVYSATLKMDAFLIARDLGGQAIDSTKIENYMGFDFITGPELTDKFQHQLFHSHYIEHLIREAEKVEATNGGFNITTSELKKYRARTIIVTTGMTRRKLHVPGEEEFQRKGVFYGHIQDISFVQGEDVAVIGGGNSALQIVENLHTVAGDIHLVSDTAFTADPTILDRIGKFNNVRKHENYKVVKFSGTNMLDGISIRKRAEEKTFDIPVKGVFIAIGLMPNSAPIAHLTQLNEKGEIIINHDCSTSCPGLFAAGDVTNAFGKRIVIASGEGAKAAMAAKQYLLNLRKNSTQDQII